MFASNESYDTAILPFASQINYVPPTKANNCPFKLEVIFCVQGAISPLLANIYLHHVYDQWAHQWRQRCATGDVIVVRYADDSIVGFEHRHEAEQFLADLKERLARFGLNLHPEKTRLIEFGRYAIANRRARGLGKPETFDFLGFKHYCGTRRDGGGFVLGRKPMAKRMRTKLREIKERLMATRHDGIDGQGLPKFCGAGWPTMLCR